MKLSEEIRDRISEIAIPFGFEYKGKRGGVDPFKYKEFYVFYNGNPYVGKYVHSIDEVMNEPFIDGHSLNELAEKLDIIELSEEIRDRISEIATLFGFEYKGKRGGVDPFNDKKFYIFYNGNPYIGKYVHSIDEVMNEPFIDGHSLNELAEKLDIIDW